MNNSSYYRSLARKNLKGKWIMTAIVAFLATCLNISRNVSFHTNYNFDSRQMETAIRLFHQTIIQNWQVPAFFKGVFIYGIVSIVLFAIVLAIIGFIVTSVLKFGYAKYQLEVYRQETPSLNVLASGIPYWKKLTALNFWISLKVFLWSLLFIVPGIIASYEYGMSYYIMAEDPTLSAEEAMMQSRTMMRGHLWEKFMLDVTFIGWVILSTLASFIGQAFLTAYMDAATVAYYNDLKRNTPIYE